MANAMAMKRKSCHKLEINHTDSVMRFDSFRALALSKSESFRVLKFYQHFLNFRALKHSNFECLSVLKISK